jgi:rod shape determining protein RodA
MQRSRARARPLEFLLSLDLLLLLGVIGLVGLGLVLIDSATFAVHGRSMVLKQSLWVALGFAVYVAVAAIPVPDLRHHVWALYLVCLILVGATYLVGVEAFGARRWLALGRFRFQPSEFLKLATVLALARSAEEYTTAEPGRRLAPLLAFGAVGAVSFIAIAKQPDLGTAASVLAVCGGMLVVCGLPLWSLFSLAVLGVVPLGFPALLAWTGEPVGVSAATLPVLAATVCLLAWMLSCRLLRLDAGSWRAFVVYASVSVGFLMGPTVWEVLNPYQRLRLTGFLAPELDPRGSGYNLIQSLIAVGSGGTWGQGLRMGKQTNLGFLPHKHTDFIFSVLGEELGFVGVCLLLGAFALMLGRLFWIAASAQSAFGALAVTGVACLLAFQTLVNLGMAMGLAPITGIPLPLVSYGGSAMLGACALLGVAQAVSREPEHRTWGSL